MKTSIELVGMRFHAFHGCLPRERSEGADYLVDFRCDYDFTKAAASDCLDDTLDYSGVFDIVSSQMAVPSNLIENVAARISDSIAGAFPELEHFSVSVTKIAPPVSGTAAAAKVTVER